MARTDLAEVKPDAAAAAAQTVIDQLDRAGDQGIFRLGLLLAVLLAIAFVVTLVLFLRGRRAPITAIALGPSQEGQMPPNTSTAPWLMASPPGRLLDQPADQPWQPVAPPQVQPAPWPPVAPPPVQPAPWRTIAPPHVQPAHWQAPTPPAGPVAPPSSQPAPIWPTPSPSTPRWLTNPPAPHVTGPRELAADDTLWEMPGLDDMAEGSQPAGEGSPTTEQASTDGGPERELGR